VWGVRIPSLAAVDLPAFAHFLYLVTAIAEFAINNSVVAHPETLPGRVGTQYIFYISMAESQASESIKNAFCRDPIDGTKLGAGSGNPDEPLRHY